jgi:alcohol dehydrogenase
MRQLTYVRDNIVEWWDVPAPKLQSDHDALVQPLAVTRCDLDLMIVHGRSKLPGPFAIGHETAGKVIDVGDAVKNFVPGDLVIVPFRSAAAHANAAAAGIPMPAPRYPSGHPTD